MFRRILFACASVFAVTATANAADIYVPGPGPGGYKDMSYPAWTGFYIGVNGGYGWSDHSDKFSLVAGGFNGIDPQGGFGGVQIGYNWQGIWHPNLVLGFEADIQGSEIKDANPGPLVGLGGKSNLDWFGTVRGRLGYAFGSSLLYATGGFAYGGIRSEFDNNFLVFGPPVHQGVDRFQKNVTAAGYTVGGGWEYKLSQAWSLKAEYQFIDLGRNDPIGASQGRVDLNPCTDHLFSPQPNCTNDAFHTVRAGLNYHFDRGYEPLK